MNDNWENKLYVYLKIIGGTALFILFLETHSDKTFHGYNICLKNKNLI
jgi:hypothetical protein